jgi:hypothetical protein
VIISIYIKIGKITQIEITPYLRWYFRFPSSIDISIFPLPIKILLIDKKIKKTMHEKTINKPMYFTKSPKRTD